MVLFAHFRPCDVDCDVPELVPVFAGGFLSVRQAGYKGHFDDPKTRQSNRRIPHGPKFVESLTALKSTKAVPTGLVSSARNGSPLSQRNLLNRQLKPTCGKLELTGVNWHWFRHAHATLLDSVGAPIGTTQACLGTRLRQSPETDTFTRPQRTSVG